MARPITTAIDLTGHTFGLWSVLRQSAEVDANGARKWVCRCRCGIERAIPGHRLRQERTTACRSCSRKAVYARSAVVRSHQRRLTEHVHVRTCPTCGTEFLGTARQVYCCPEHRPSRRKES